MRIEREVVKRDEEWDQVERTKAQLRQEMENMVAYVSTYTENTMIAGGEPTLDGFFDQHPEWEYDTHIPTVQYTMERVKEACLAEMSTAS